MLKIAKYRGRRLGLIALVLAGLIGLIVANPDNYQVAQGESSTTITSNEHLDENSILASTVLEKLTIKGRAPKTGYQREEFYKNWPQIEGCSLRQIIIKRELGDTATLAEDQCTVIAGEFDEPYTGKHLRFHEKSEFSHNIQIDHVVALSDAWQKGAQYKEADLRSQMATDPLNLLAVDSSANQQKSDGDAATWLPSNKAFRCQYIARQISVKYKYDLWVTQAEHDAMAKVLSACPYEAAVGIELREEE